VTVDPALLELLRTRAGLRTTALEGDSGAAVVRRRMQAIGIDRDDEYRRRVERDPMELETLVAAVAVPETWLFRYLTSCEWLIGWLRQRRRDRGSAARVRLLSAPCATGQEPISLAVCAAVAGWPLGSIDVEAVDASGAAIAIAREAATRPMPLRDPLPDWAEAWFRSSEGGVLPQAGLLERIRFEHADLRTWTSSRHGRFDVVACRNLLIYLEPEARRRVMGTCERSLAEDGVLLVGHADHDRDLFGSFESVGVSQSFAHRRRPIGSPTHAGRDSETTGGTSAAVGLRSRGAGDGSSARAETIAPESGGDSKPVDPRPEGVHSTAASSNSSLAHRDPSSPSVSTGHVGVEPRDWRDAVRARSLADAGRLVEAERLCRERLADDPTDVTAIELMGCVRLADGDVGDAGEWFRRLVYLAPDHVEGLLHLASIAERSGDAEQAARHRDRARRASDVSEDRDPTSAEGAAA